MDVMSASEQNAPTAGRNLSKLATDLGRRMSKRSSPEELVAKHIMPRKNILHLMLVESLSQNFSPGLVAQKQALEQENIKNSLNRKLSIRSTKDDLKLRNIIKGMNDLIYNVGSSENLTKSEEKFAAKQTTLKSILKKRPDRDLLKEKNILKGSISNTYLKVQI